MKKLCFVLTFVVLLFTGCQKDRYSSALMENVYQDVHFRALEAPAAMFEVWNTTYQNHPMSVFCACDCSTSDVIQHEINTQIINYKGFEDFRLWEYSCEVFMNGIAGTCGEEIEVTDTMIQNKLDELYAINLITAQEQNLIAALSSEVNNSLSTVNFDRYKALWEQLDLTEHPSNGLVSLSLIEYSKQAVDYFGNFPNPPIDQSTFLLHKVAGGLFGALWNIAAEEIVGDGINSGDEYWRTAAVGFVGGAIGSL